MSTSPESKTYNTDQCGQPKTPNHQYVLTFGILIKILIIGLFLYSKQKSIKKIFHIKINHNFIRNMKIKNSELCFPLSY